jgi:hypothetical protein
MIEDVAEEQGSKGRSNRPAAAPAAVSSKRWYVLGFGLVGGAIGYFAGASESPIVATVIPVLFALLGGASGLYVSRIDLASAQGVSMLDLFGKSLLTFSLACMLGAMYGTALRTGAGIRGFVPSLDDSRVAELPKARRTASDDLELLVFRNQLHLLGASEAEQGRIMAKAAQELDRTLGVIGAGLLRKVPELAALTRRAIPDRLVADSAFEVEQSEIATMFELPGMLELDSQTFTKWALRLEAAEAVSRRLLLTDINKSLKYYDTVLRDRDSMKWLSKQKKAGREIRRAIRDLRDQLSLAREQFGMSDWSGSSDLVKAAVEVIKLRRATDGVPPRAESSLRGIKR